MKVATTMPDNPESHTHTFNTAINPELMKMQGMQDRISFTGVTFRNFTLRASINRLQTFCDNYLNFADDPGGVSSGHFFKAAAPMVTLSILNYGKMSTETENLGWIAQHEVLFSVPVEWYKVDKAGQLVFHDWAFVCPFIFVDNDQSLGVGREVYGWTKVRGWLQPSTTTWTTDPRKPRRLLSMGTSLFPDLYAGERQQDRTLIEVIQDAPMSLFRSPYTADDPYNPWWSGARNLRRSMSAMSGAFQFISGLPLFGNAGSRYLGAGSRMYGRLMQNMMAGMPWLKSGFDTRGAARSRAGENPANAYMNNLTLKQFRDAEEPDLACFQALVNSKISIERLIDGGLLGGSNLMLGDPTGGYRIHVHEYAEQPIVDTLGLEVSDRERDEFGTPVAVLSPMMPSWMACDLRYDMGRNLCWRSKDSEWHGDACVTPPARSAGRQNRYNTTRGAAIQDSVGPLHYPDTTLRIIPLLADKVRLQYFCDEVISDLKKTEPGAGEFEELIHRFENEMEAANKKKSKSGESLADRQRQLDDDVKAIHDRLSGELSTDESVQLSGKHSLPRYIGLNHFEPIGSNVYMVITTFGSQYGKMYSEKNNLGLTAKLETAFFMPVTWYFWDESADKVRRRLAILTPYIFCDSMRHALSESEVNGRPAKHCQIESDDDWWLRESDPGSTKKVRATLRTLLMPALNVGQPAEMRKFIEIVGIGEEPDAPTSDAEARGEEEAKKLYELFGRSGACIDFITLKQYRAANSIRSHCYQSLVQIRSRIEDVLVPRSDILENIQVNIHAYPTMPIVKQLGIKVNKVDSSGSSIVEQIKPVKPSSIRVSMRQELGVNLYTRLQDGNWQRASAEVDDQDTH